MIETRRLALITLDADYLARWLFRKDTPDRGFSDPAGFLTGAEDVVGLRLQQLARAPDLAPWLLRAIVVRDKHHAVGFIGCHGGPDSGRIEIGYEVLPAFRNRGYAREAVEGLLTWAATQGVHTARASVAPTNAPSRAVLARLGFLQIAEQIDPDDGPELVLEKLL